MRKIDRLKKEALEACKFRGHNMSRFRTVLKDEVAYATCLNYLCYKIVEVNTNPKPNQIDIGGEAVALGCED